MGLTFIAFEGYDLIATVAEEIKAPEKTIPRATSISLAVTVFIYLMILLVCIGAIQPESGKNPGSIWVSIRKRRLYLAAVFRCSAGGGSPETFSEISYQESAQPIISDLAHRSGFSILNKLCIYD
jgi:amino acid transporter